MDIEDKEGISVEEARRQTYAGFLWIVREKGYKVGWAAVKFRALLGEFPPRDWNVEPEAPRQGLAWWIRKQQQEFAKVQRAKEKALTPIMPMVTASGLMSGEDWAVGL